ncbi:hypothetical protein HU200_039566 [Digitaria exilis]|uniref:Uncharacterized protein n=1 Tax=Digitaria exilis TaxID=1010633 RepID=A0A835BAC1_9POAL|nr:hypothetical protein HU200_039566 [Digitaria exilis]
MYLFKVELNIDMYVFRMSRLDPSIPGPLSSPNPGWHSFSPPFLSARPFFGGEFIFLYDFFVGCGGASNEPHVLHLSNLDLLMHNIRASTFCIYPKPSTDVGGFDAGTVHAFESCLPFFPNHFFLFAGRIATNPSSGIPEVHCGNQGAELLVGQATAVVTLTSLDYGALGSAVRRVHLPYGDDVALTVQVVSFATTRAPGRQVPEPPRQHVGRARALGDTPRRTLT